MGDNWSSRWWAVSPANISSAACSEAGPLSARPEETTGGADEDDGQRGHVLHAADAFHLHFQVGTHAELAQTHPFEYFTIKIIACFPQYTGHASIWL